MLVWRALYHLAAFQLRSRLPKRMPYYPEHSFNGVKKREIVSEWCGDFSGHKEQCANQMKKICCLRCVMYVILFSLSILINYFIKPYPEELVMLDIRASIDNDAVLVAYMLNCLILFISILTWIYNIRNSYYRDIYLISLTALTVMMIIYWRSYM